MEIVKKFYTYSEIITRYNDFAMPSYDEKLTSTLTSNISQYLNNPNVGDVSVSQFSTVIYNLLFYYENYYFYYLLSEDEFNNDDVIQKIVDNFITRLVTDLLTQSNSLYLRYRLISTIVAKTLDELMTTSNVDNTSNEEATGVSGSNQSMANTPSSQLDNSGGFTLTHSDDEGSVKVSFEGAPEPAGFTNFTQKNEGASTNKLSRTSQGVRKGSYLHLMDVIRFQDKTLADDILKIASKYFITYIG